MVDVSSNPSLSEVRAPFASVRGRAPMASRRRSPCGNQAQSTCSSAAGGRDALEPLTKCAGWSLVVLLLQGKRQKSPGQPVLTANTYPTASDSVDLADKEPNIQSQKCSPDDSEESLSLMTTGGSGISKSYVPILALLLTSCVTSGK